MRRAILICVGLLWLIAAAPAEANGHNDRVVIEGPVTVGPGQVANDIVVADGDVTVAGRVTGDIVVASGTLRIAGTVKGDVFTVADRATLAPGARVGGDVSYVDEKPSVAPGAQVGGKVKRVNVDKLSGPVGFATGIGAWLAISISALLLGLLALWLWPRAAVAAQEAGASAPGKSFGVGLLLFFGIPIIAVLLLVTLLGLPLGLLLLLALVPLYALGYTTTAWVLGRRILGPDRGRILAFLAGLVILRLIALIPIVGGLVWFLATLFGLGALFIAAARARRQPEPSRGGPAAYPQPA